jgi:hypothetical protein
MNINNAGDIEWARKTREYTDTHIDMFQRFESLELLVYFCTGMGLYVMHT